jgi:integrase
VPWIEQGMRHSYCSYWLVANNNDTDELVMQLGHRDKNVMWDSYYRATTPKKAAQFWSIRPPGWSDDKVIPFVA